MGEDRIAVVDEEKGVIGQEEDFVVSKSSSEYPINRLSQDTAEIQEGSDDGTPKIRDFGPPASKVPTAQDWTGPDDPENPYNWAISRRVYNTAIIAMVGFAITFGSSVYTPAYPEVMQQFGVGTTAALLPLSLYIFAVGLGPMLSAPLSETYGRRVVYLLSVPISMLFTLGAGFSNSFASLLVCRTLAGLTGAPVLAVGAGSLADMWPPHLLAVASCAFLLCPFAGPALGPVVGGFTAMNLGWRWTQWDILFITLPACLLTLTSSETYKKTILQRRAKRCGVAPPKGGLAGFALLRVVLTRTLVRPLHMLATEPIVIFLSAYVAFSFAVLYAFFAAFPIVFEGVYGFNPGESGLAFLAVGVGVLLAGVTGVAFDRRIYHRMHFQALAEGRGRIAPEHRLYSAMAGSIGLPIGLFWLAWTSRRDIHWICPMIAAVPFAWGNLSIFLSSALYMIDVYGALNGASAMAANGLLRYALGAAFPLFTVQMFNALGIAWATSIFGFISIAMLPIPWVLFKFGPRIRAKSGYDTLKA